MPTNNPPARTTLLDALNQLRDTGFSGHLIATTKGAIRCTNCRVESNPASFTIQGYYRLEGASDAADMNLLAWADCPHCSAKGTLTLGYGPNSSPADESVLRDLNLEHIPNPGLPPTTPNTTTR